MADSFRPKAQDARFPSPTLAEDILNAVETLVCVTNGDGDVVYVSPAVRRILGYEIEDVLGQQWWEKVYSGDPRRGQEYREKLKRAARGEISASFTHTVRAFSCKREERWLVWRDCKGPGDFVIGVGQDVTGLREAEQLREQREQEFTAVFQNASDGMLILNERWEYQQVNGAACSMFGVPSEALIGREQGSLLRSSIDPKKFREEALKAGQYSVEVEFQRADGQVRKVELTLTKNFRPGHHLMILRDVSERRRIQAQLSQAQRLEAVGKLAGGVAHDFNNMLTAIRGYAELLQRTVVEEKHKRYVDAILGATARAADTTQRLLAFSRKQLMKPQVLELNQAVNGTVELLKRVIGEDIELVLLLGPDEGKVKVDPSHFGEMLMNLAVNARDAMPEGGKLVIETRSVLLDDEYVLKHIPVTAGKYWLLAVTDTGTGIPPEIQAHIFEPFFTTKEQGKGTGLGLSMVYGIVKQSGGYVWVYSEPGHGTTFKIYLPYFASEEEAESARKHLTLLVIEDDETIRMTAIRALEDDGYRVLPARDGTEALAICQQWAEAIDLVLTDVMAPGMSGEDLMGYFAVKYPSLAVVHMSGFGRARLEQAHTFFPDALFLSKPFTIAELREIVEEALRRRGKNPGADPE